MEQIKDTCSLCDIAIECFLTPGRGRGYRYSLMYVLASPTKSDYKKGICTSRNTKKIQEFNDKLNMLAYYTTLIKCVTGSVVRRLHLDNCNPRFRKELFDIKPKIIIPIGDVATKEFLEYDYFKNVVDKPFNIKLNNQTVIIYPIYHPSYATLEEIDIIYTKSFNIIAFLYSKFVDTNYLILNR
jgi:uracil-DNA glycosylase family 4